MLPVSPTVFIMLNSFPHTSCSLGVGGWGHTKLSGQANRVRRTRRGLGGSAFASQGRPFPCNAVSGGEWGRKVGCLWGESGDPLPGCTNTDTSTSSRHSWWRKQARVVDRIDRRSRHVLGDHCCVSGARDRLLV